jgi:hypothetical protein
MGRAWKWLRRLRPAARRGGRTITRFDREGSLYRIAALREGQRLCVQSTANFVQADGRNCICPSSPAHVRFSLLIRYLPPPMTPKNRVAQQAALRQKMAQPFQLVREQ